jgi:hypothetical protein
VEAGNGPKDNLGLDPGIVNLNDGSYIKVNMYPISGLTWIPANKNSYKAIGTFYVQMDGSLCAYDLPGGSFSAEFTGGEFTQLPEAPEPGESWTLDGTFKLNILQATGIYQPLAGGHIHMADILKYRADDGTFLEECFCHVHPELVTP